MALSGESPVTSVDRALSLLGLLSARGALRVSEAGSELGLPLSSTHRLLAALESAGFIARGLDSRVYVQGPMVGRLVSDWQAEEDLLARVSRPHLQHLVEEFSETAHLVVLRGRNVRFVAGAESQRAVRAGLRVGAEYPAHATSAGKAVLAMMSPATVEFLYPQEQLAAPTAASLTSRSDLFAELVEVRERGYAINDGESEDAIVGVGAAIIDPARRVRGGIVVGGPSARFTVEDADLVGREVAATAQALGGQL